MKKVACKVILALCFTILTGLVTAPQADAASTRTVIRYVPDPHAKSYWSSGLCHQGGWGMLTRLYLQPWARQLVVQPKLNGKVTKVLTSKRAYTKAVATEHYILMDVGGWMPFRPSNIRVVRPWSVNNTVPANGKWFSFKFEWDSYPPPTFEHHSGTCTTVVRLR